MTTSSALTQRLTTMLQTKADQVTSTDEPFDPQRRAFIDADLDADVGTTERRVHPPARLLLAVAGAALVVGLVVVVRAAVRSDEPADTATAGTDPSWAAQADGPPIASVQLASATVELHQDGTVQRLCVRQATGDDLRCETGLTANVVVDDTWYVAVARTGGAPAPLIAPGWGDPPYTGDPGMLPLDDQALPAETGNDAGWAFTLATPPTDVDFVWLEQGLTHTKLDRPTTRPSG